MLCREVRKVSNSRLTVLKFTNVLITESNFAFENAPLVSKCVQLCIISKECKIIMTRNNIVLNWNLEILLCVCLCIVAQAYPLLVSSVKSNNMPVNK